MFDSLIHADWSAQETKRWMATAERNGLGWIVDAPRPVPSGPELAKLIQDWTGGGRTVLAGFDFPIGLPASFGKQTGLGNFPTALFGFGSGEWKDFYNVADEPKDISTKRPFYPNTSHKGRRQADMFGPLGVGSMDELRRECERKTPDNRRAACPLFWTLGANQVGKAAIDGWQHVIRPAVARGAKLWPFDGRLDDLGGGQS
jgi:hypothetical protein